jgi:hypothetical protein
MLLAFHAGLMTTALALTTAGVAVARFGRGRPWWFKIHRVLGFCAVFAIVLGFMAAFLMVVRSGDEHFGVLHARVGAAVILAVASSAVLGQLQFVLKSRRAQLRMTHRALGAASWCLLFLNFLSGLFLAGVLPDMRLF